MPQLSLHSPIGDLTVSEDAGRIVALDWGWGRDQSATPLLSRACARLQDYFDGQCFPRDFDLPLAPAGTVYQHRVWEALRRIPYGTTRTYSDLAAEIGGSPRSVGQAGAANPIPILIPCHRLVARQRRAGQPQLGGYSGPDGPDGKCWLLDLERRAADGIA